MKNSSPNTQTAALTCHNLVVGYADKPVISNINISFKTGQFIALLGPNGAGKTTLLRTLSRHQAPLAGSIQLGRQSLEQLRQADLAKIMAVVLTDKVTPPLFTAFQFVALGRYPHTGFLGRLTDKDRDVVLTALAAVHADDLSHRDFADLSDGERQKVLVARALAQEPKILLLDEPTAHLDLKHRLEVMAILRNLCWDKGITVIASLHDVDIAAKVSDRVALVKGGAITSWGSPEQILTSETVADLYDFRTASFSHHLGSIEIRSERYRGRAFVVAGMGKGASIYRMLARRGYGISTGMLLSNDLDCYVAAGLGAKCVSQPPGSAFTEESRTLALREMEASDMVIEVNYQTTGPYQENQDLIRRAAKMGKPVFSFRTASGRNETDGTIAVADSNELFTAMEVHCP